MGRERRCCGGGKSGERWWTIQHENVDVAGAGGDDCGRVRDNDDGIGGERLEATDYSPAMKTLYTH